MTVFYLDTSVAIHVLDGHADAWFDDVTSSPEHELLSSRLLQTELTRVMRRDDLPVVGREQILQWVSLTPVTEVILTGAEAIAVHLKTLDAIHLATALALGSSTVVATHDAGMKTAAEFVGLTWVDPVADHG